jgi:exodeoxyribonuclease-3
MQELRKRPARAAGRFQRGAGRPRRDNPKRWEGGSTSSPERAAFRNCSTRLRRRVSPEQPDRQFSWWDYRLAAFQRGWGLRIDHILLSPALAARCKSCSIDVEPRKLERPSDHAPVIAELDL